MPLCHLGNFAKYDFGAAKNVEIYRQPEPPHYDIEQINVPVITYWGDNDWLVEPTVSISLVDMFD